MKEYPPGYFSEPVRKWRGLCEYEPRLHLMLRPRGMSEVDLAIRSRDARELQLVSTSADAKWGARGTVPGLAVGLFKDKPPPTVVSLKARKASGQ